MLPSACIDCEHYSNEPDPRFKSAAYATLVCIEPSVLRARPDTRDRAVTHEEVPPPAWCPLRVRGRDARDDELLDD